MTREEIEEKDLFELTKQEIRFLIKDSKSSKRYGMETFTFWDETYAICYEDQWEDLVKRVCKKNTNRLDSSIFNSIPESVYEYLADHNKKLLWDIIEFNDTDLAYELDYEQLAEIMGDDYLYECDTEIGQIFRIPTKD